MSAKKDDALQSARDLYDDINDMQSNIYNLLYSDIEDIVINIKHLHRDMESISDNAGSLIDLIDELEDGE